MIYISEKNKNEMITMEEAEAILKMAKRLYPGPLSGVEIDYDEHFALYRDLVSGERIILIPDVDDYDFNEEEFNRIGKNILEHVNAVHGYDFDTNTKTKCIHALCHEIGHAIDFYYQNYLGNENYEDDVEEEYYEFYQSTHRYHAAMDALRKYMDEYGIEGNEEVIENMKIDIEMIESELDYDYRMITSEKAADVFSAHFMATHLRYLRFMFA